MPVARETTTTSRSAWIVVVLVLYLLRAASAYIQIILSLQAGHRLVSAMRVDVFRHLQTLSLSFYDRWRSGDILSRIINDIQIVQVTLVEGFVRVLPHIFTPVGVQSRASRRSPSQP